MKERPILFSAEMVRAILDGRKTQTRRVIKPQPINALDRPPPCDCPYGKIGDRLWVRETQAKFHPAVYMADVAEDFYPSYLWTPSIHMPRVASRITLEITAARVERLQDISEADAMAEGVSWKHNPALPTTPVNAFAALWTSVGGDWDANPWVWCIDFQRVQP